MLFLKPFLVSFPCAFMPSHPSHSLKSMEPAKIAMTMSEFEKAFENIEVAVGGMGASMETGTTHHTTAFCVTMPTSWFC